MPDAAPRRRVSTFAWPTEVMDQFLGMGRINGTDIAVLVSSDRDFVPVAEFLETRGIKVIHGAFPPQGSELTGRCWGSINVPRLREAFRR